MIKKHNYLITRNNINEGIYFTKKEDAKEYVKLCKKRNILGDFKIIKKKG